MKVTFPSPMQPLVSIFGILSADWMRFLRDMWQALGYNVQTVSTAASGDATRVFGVPVYQDLAATIVSASYNTLVGDIRCPEMATGADTIDQFAARLPNNYREGSDLTPFIAYCAADATAGNVRWELGYGVGWAPVTEPVRTAQAITETVEGKTQAAPEAALVPDRVDFSAIPGANFKKGDSVVARIERNGLDAADTYGGSVFILAAGFKYEIEGLGHERAHP